MSRKNIEAEIKYITKQIIEKYKPEKIILFGSIARGDFGPDSDLDFLVIKKKTPRYRIDRMHQLRSLIDYSIATDFLIYRPDEFEKRLQMGDPFLKVVAEEGKVLYARS